MNALEQFLEELRLRKGFERKDELAAHIGLSPQELNRAYKRGYLTDEKCVLVARELGTHPALVILARESIKEKNAKYSKIWEEAFLATRQALSGSLYYRK